MLIGKQASHDAPPVSALDMDKVRSTLKQFVRDWAEEVSILADPSGLDMISQPLFIRVKKSVMPPMDQS